MISRDDLYPRPRPVSLSSASSAEPAKPTLLQALSDKRMAAVLFLSFASGLPFNLTNFSLQAWLASEGLSIKTIETYRERIKGKLNAKSATDLVRQAVCWVETGI